MAAIAAPVRQFDSPARRRTGAAWVGLLSWLSLGGPPAWGQTSPAADEALIPVEQGVEDISPVAEGLRYIDPRSIQQPSFDQLWRLRGTDYFVRVDGALHAVFRRSDYQNTPQGIQVAVPADTVFYIGAPTELLSAAADEIDRSLQGQRGDPRRRGLSPPTLRPPTSRVNTRVNRYVSTEAEALRSSARELRRGDEAEASRETDRPLRRAAAPVDPEAERQRAERACKLLRLALGDPTHDDD